MPADDGAPLMRTEFATSAGKTITRARVYATAKGNYQMRLNGQPVGDQHLAPGFTDYPTRIQHQTYDVTDQVVPGVNAWGAELGKGWYAGTVGWVMGEPGYGTDVSLLARLRIDYSDGTSQWVSTNPTSWRTRPGPHTATDLTQGESYDARLMQPGWDLASHDDSFWRTVVALGTDVSKVVPQPDEPVRTTQVMPTVERTHAPNGAWVYDLGQEITGIARLELQGKAGSTATIRYVEMLDPDKNPYYGTLRDAKATDTFTFDRDHQPVTYEPEFTIHGFRYVVVMGTDTPPTAAQVTGQVWGSDLRPTGTLTTSSTLVNQIASNVSWGQRGNYVSVPTDTPVRAERLGWTGDTNVFAPTASYLSDTRAFLRKWLVDLQSGQHSDGNYEVIAPYPPKITSAPPGSPGWRTRASACRTHCGAATATGR